MTTMTRATPTGYHNRATSRIHYKLIVAHVNRKQWWHVTPQDPNAYDKRGMFLASSFKEAEFWGRPLRDPLRVSIVRPLVGDEGAIETILFGRRVSDDDITLEERWKLDAKMKKAALVQGYDSIVLMSPKSFSALKASGKIPRSIELNILDRSRLRTL
jgi:hypothetical protein